MTVILDCRGLDCPEPLLKTRDRVDQTAPRSLTVVVSNTAAAENVTRFLQARGYDVARAQNGEEWRLEAMLREGAPAAASGTGTHAPAASGSSGSTPHGSTKDAAAKTVPAGEKNKTLVLVFSDVVGSGSDELGGKLMVNFIRTLPELGDSLWRVIFLNGGVRLSITGSPVLETLQTLEQQGVSILSCGSCLEFYGLREQMAVGEMTNMLDVVTSMQVADKVLRV